MSSRTLFVLAGYTAAGKSTLSAYAIRNNIPLFGKEDDQNFRLTKVPPKFPEELLSTQEKIDHGTWFSYGDIPYLMRAKAIPDVIFLHLDLITVRIPKNCSVEGVKILTDGHLNKKVFHDALSVPFFRLFDQIVINTLFVPWEQIKNQWQLREAGSRPEHQLGRHRLFEVGHIGAAVHRSIYDSWFHSIHVLRPKLAFVTTIKDNKLFMRLIN